MSMPIRLGSTVASFSFCNLQCLFLSIQADVFLQINFYFASSDSCPDLLIIQLCFKSSTSIQMCKMSVVITDLFLLIMFVCGLS
jgi:hypothetical protein